MGNNSSIEPNKFREVGDKLIASGQELIDNYNRSGRSSTSERADMNEIIDSLRFIINTYKDVFNRYRIMGRGVFTSIVDIGDWTEGDNRRAQEVHDKLMIITKRSGNKYKIQVVPHNTQLHR